MKRLLYILAGVVLCSTLTYAQQSYEQHEFSFRLPDNCIAMEDSVAADFKDCYVYDSVSHKIIAYVRYQGVKTEKGKSLNYKMMRKAVLQSDSTTQIVYEPPFYDLLRQELAYTYTGSKGDTVYEVLKLKANSYITIRSFWPPSEQAQTVISSFDNHTTFRGNLVRMRQNAGGIVMTIFLSLLAFAGYRARNEHLRWLYILITVLLFALAVLCLWQDFAVMGFVLGLSLLIWCFFFSHNKVLMWIIDSIF